MKTAIKDETPKELFLASLERCAGRDSFIPTFYDRFLGSSDDIRNRFRFTSFEKQNAMLLNSLRLATGAISGEPDALRELKKRAESHSRYRLNIDPKLYDIWLSSLVETASKNDPSWSPQIEAAWRTVLGFVIHRMAAGY